METNKETIASYLEQASSSIFATIAEEDESAFEKFCELRISHSSNTLLGLAFTCTTSYMYIMSLLNPEVDAFVFSVVIPGLVLNSLLMVVIYFQYLTTFGQFPNLSPHIPAIMNALSVFESLALGLYLIARVFNGSCDKLDQIHRWSCNSEYEVGALPQGTLLILMYLPLLLSIALKTVRTSVVLLCWSIVVASVIISISFANSFYSIPVLVFYVPLSLTCIWEIHRQNVYQFLLLKEQQTLIDTNKRLAEETQNELRFMIANMAHDLKTPLSAFMNGVESLSKIVSDLAKSETDVTKVEDKSLLCSAKECLNNLFTVNSFMTMTVNRCIDYMKASKGIKLEPRMETLNLEDVLSMPIRTMRDLQSRIAIVQAPIPAGVGSHIITDLQWLQENLFCLISNAVKYSSHGHINVSVILTTVNESPVLTAKWRKDSPSPSSDLDPAVGGSGTQERYCFLDRMVSSPSIDFTDVEKGDTHSEDSCFKGSLRGRSPKKGFKSVPTSPVNASAAAAGDGNQNLLLIEVEDTGIGLSDEVKESLFTPFKQAQRRAGGTGLGLYSLAKRVDALGGYYGVRNRNDGEQGSVFWFAIPYRPDKSAVSVVSETPNSLDRLAPSPRNSSKVEVGVDNAAPQSPERKMRVLVVDDSLTIQKMTSHLLKRHGYLVDQEENGATALEALERARSAGVLYDVMLIDLNMPVMDGLEAMKRLREMERLRSLDQCEGGGGVECRRQRVFAFSANSDSTTMKEAFEAGADDFICKPFSLLTFQEKFQS